MKTTNNGDPRIGLHDRHRRSFSPALKTTSRTALLQSSAPKQHQGMTFTPRVSSVPGTSTQTQFF